VSARRSVARLAAVAGALLASGELSPIAGQQVTLLAGGDIGWVRTVKPPVSFTYQSPVLASITVYSGFGESVNGETEDRRWTNVPFLNRPAMRDSIAARLGRDLDEAGAHHVNAITFPLEFASLEEDIRYPFQKLRSLIRSADVAFGNLEMALEADPRFHTGEYVGHPRFAEALRWAGFSVVSTANVHSLDGELTGLKSTLEALHRAGVGTIGAGLDLERARKPHVVEANGLSIAFLGYTQSVAHGAAWSFANENLAGVMAMDPLLIAEDIRRIRDQVDYVAVSLHWGIENTRETHPDARRFAHDIIDAGADIILGHQSNLPQGVEVYNGKVILYSPGNLVFGHNHTYWGDNYLARFTLTPDRITQVEIIPIAGQGNDLAQPYQMVDAPQAPPQGGGGRGGRGGGGGVSPAELEALRARSLLRDVQQLSQRLDTRMEVVAGIGVIRP
jgi:poly-gamma-glutamate synthesis protein (capsule biosynthesis protein)